MKFTVLNTYDALVQKARKIQQLARFFNRQEAANGQLKSSYTGQSSIFYILDFSQSRFLYVDPFYENMINCNAPAGNRYTIHCIEDFNISCPSI